MENVVRKKRKQGRKHWKWLIPVGLLLALAVGFLIYAGGYYHADETALAALESDSTAVSRTDIGQPLALLDFCACSRQTSFPRCFPGALLPLCLTRPF